MAMRIRGYGAEYIDQYRRSRATLDATERHHWENPPPPNAPADAIVINFGVKIKSWHYEIAFQS